MAHHFNKYQHKVSVKKSIYAKLKEKAKESYEHIQRDKNKNIQETLKLKAHSSDQDNINGDIVLSEPEVNINQVTKQKIDEFEAEYLAFIESLKKTKIDEQVDTLNTKVETLEQRVEEITTTPVEIINKEENVDKLSEEVNNEVEQKTPEVEENKEETTVKKARKTKKKKAKMDSVIDENPTVETEG